MRSLHRKQTQPKGKINVEDDSLYYRWWMVVFSHDQFNLFLAITRQAMGEDTSPVDPMISSSAHFSRGFRDHILLRAHFPEFINTTVFDNPAIPI